MKQKKDPPFKLFCIIGIILGIIAIPLSLITFFGAFATAPSGIAIGFSAFGLLDKKIKKGLPIAGVLLGMIGMTCSLYQYFTYQPIFEAKSHVEGMVKDAVIKAAKEKVVAKWNGDPAPNNTPPIKIESKLHAEGPPVYDPIPLPKDFLFATVDNLRIRASADLNSEVLNKMNYGEIAINLNEQSETKERITLGGVKKNDHWLKVQYAAHNFVEPTIGWIYGGALVKPSNEYFHFGNNKYIKTLTNESRENVSELLGIEIGSGYPFHGIIEYKKSADGNYIREGKFYVKGKSKKGLSDMEDFQSSEMYRGSFKDDQLHGILENDSNPGYETGSNVKIKYENGNCVWFSMIHQSEDYIETNEEHHPKDCSFEYIAKGLKPK